MLSLSRALPQWFALSFMCMAAHAHTDLELQILDVSNQLAASPGDADLLLRRGDLYRRHEDWVMAGDDFAAVRRLNPRHSLIDWFEGRLEVQVGDWISGEALLTRFLSENPAHAPAYHIRADARWRLGRPVAAAGDFGKAIMHSERPAPALYRSRIIALVAAGAEYHEKAAATISEGLTRFPREVGLIGLGVDLGLARSEPRSALALMSRLPERLLELPQWQYRRALWHCVAESPGRGSEEFASLARESASQSPGRAGTWHLPVAAIEALAADPVPAKCQAASLQMLLDLEP